MKAPEHYKSREIEGKDVIDLVDYWKLSFCEGNILKYLLRDKGQDIDDLRKIIDYAEREIKQREKPLSVIEREPKYKLHTKVKSNVSGEVDKIAKIMNSGGIEMYRLYHHSKYIRKEVLDSYYKIV